MKRVILSSGVAAVLAFSAACGGGQPSADGGSASGAKATKAEPAAASAGASEFGVPECDRYIKKYVDCVESKVPESARGMMKQQLEQSKAAWKQAASTPQGREGLAMGCTQAEAAAKPAMSAYGCTW